MIATIYRYMVAYATMSKVDYRLLSPLQRSRSRQSLRTAIKSTHNCSPEIGLLSSMLTESEIVMLSRRIQIARLLLQGHRMREICSTLHVGFTTVRSVDRWLYKTCDKYRLIFPPLHSTKNPPKQQVKLLSRKYPLHFILLTLSGKNS